MNRFCCYELRTTGVDAARSFYRDLLGAAFWDDGAIRVGELPAQAAAHGAPPHWLGHIGVEDATGTMLRFVEHGAMQLGPTRGTGDHAAVILRDPFGAVVGLVPRSHIRETGRVAWHLLCSRDEERAFALYADLFGWTSVQSLDLGPDTGRHVTFTWDGATDAVGGISDLARRPHVHPQWLFFFPTENLDVSLARVRDLSGLTRPVIVTKEGHRLAPCDDPHGAAFGLYQTVA